MHIVLWARLVPGHFKPGRRCGYFSAQRFAFSCISRCRRSRNQLGTRPSSGRTIPEPRRENEIRSGGFPGCVGEILANIAWRIGNFFEYRAPSIDHGDKVFQVVAGQEVLLSTSPECFHFGTQEVGSCNHPDWLTAGQNKWDSVIECSLIPEVGIAQNFFAERQYIEFQLPMEPAAGEWLLTRILYELRFAKSASENAM